MIRVKEIFDIIIANKISTFIEFFQGYWHAKMEESCKERTTSILDTGIRNLKWCNELMSSDATLNRIMDKIFANVDNINCYINDVAIRSKLKQEQTTHLETTFKLLCTERLRFHLKEWFFMQPWVRYPDIILTVLASIWTMLKLTRLVTQFR